MSAGLTHPVIASLDHPLFAFGGKRVSYNWSFKYAKFKLRLLKRSANILLIYKIQTITFKQ